MHRQTHSSSNGLELAAIAPIVWAKWGEVFLEALRQESLDAPDGLSFRAMNSDAGVRVLLIVCTTSRERIREVEAILSSSLSSWPVDWGSYSVAQLVFKTEKGSGLGCQEHRDDGGATALVLCATRPAAVRTLEKLFDLPE